MSEVVSETKILIVGTGGNAVSVARELQHRGEEDYLFISRSDRFGGTWLDATFPGAQVDQPTSLYEFSYAMHPHWSKPYPDADELLDYIVRISEEYGLPAKTHFGVNMIDAGWSPDETRWLVNTDKGLYKAQFLIMITGYLDEPVSTDLPGMDDFAGRIVYAARWPEGYVGTGEDVLVVGSGATAVEVIPEMVKTAKHVTSLQRTPTWVHPKPNAPFSDDEKAAKAADGRVMANARAKQFALLELTGPEDLKQAELLGLAWLESEILDPKLRAKLTPTHAYGCKRPIWSDLYLKALTAPNVDVVFDGLKEFSVHGVLTDSGREILADTVVLTTGYHWGTHILNRIHRGDGTTVAEHQKGWVRAYKSILVAGCPNLFLVGGAGPNSQQASGLFSGEVAATYIGLSLAEVDARGAQTIEVDEAAEVDWKIWADAILDLGPTVRGGCRNYSLDGYGHNKAAWPGTPGDMEYQLGHLTVEHHVFG